VYLAYREAIRRQIGDPEYDFLHVEFKKALRNHPEHRVNLLEQYVLSLLRWRIDSDYSPSPLTVQPSDAQRRTVESTTALGLIEELVRTGTQLPVPIKKIRDI